MLVDTGHSLEGTDQDAHFSQPTDQPWRRPPSHGTFTTTPTATVPLETIPRDFQQLLWPGLQDRTGHTGSTYWRLRPNDYDVDQYQQPYLLSKHAGIGCGVLVDDNRSGWRREGGSGPGRLGPTPGVELRVNALP